MSFYEVFISKNGGMERMSVKRRENVNGGGNVKKWLWVCPVAPVVGAVGCLLKFATMHGFNVRSIFSYEGIFFSLGSLAVGAAIVVLLGKD